MLKEISKKLTMKKSFFVTQLEGFFNSITQEYQEIIHQKELENTVLKEKNTKLQKDVDNLVKIKNDLSKSLDEEKEKIRQFEKEFDKLNANPKGRHEELLQENESLKKSLEDAKKLISKNEDLVKLKERLKHLQNYLAKGADAYNQNSFSQKSEEIIKELNEKLKM